MENLFVKVDDVGRIVIPKRVRTQLGIENNELLLLTRRDDMIIIEKEDKSTDLDKIRDKAQTLSNKYGLDFLIANDYKIVFATNEYKKYENIRVNNEVVEKIVFSNNTVIAKDVVITKPHYYCSLSFDNYTNGKLFVVFDDESKREYAELIINLLS